VTDETASRRLHRFFDEQWEWLLREFPTFATYVGDRRYNDRWPDESLEAVARRRVHAREALAEIEAIDRASLEEADRLNYDIFHLGAKREVEGERFREELMPLNQMQGIQQDVPNLIHLAPRNTRKDFDDLLARLDTLPVVIEQTIDAMREGAALGITPPRIVLGDVARQIGSHVVDDAEKSPIWAIAFAGPLPQLAAGEEERIRREAARLVVDRVAPAYADLLRYFTDEYLGRTRGTISLADLPDGREWYRHRVRVMTTTDLEPDEIHEIGLAEVQRIRGEMERVRESARFDGDLDAFFHYLRTDPKFFFTEREALVTAYRDIAKRLDPELPKLFGKLPRLPYGVLPVPEFAEQSQTTAYYYPGSPEAGRAGYFFANTYNLPARPKWEMEALTAHEAVPGHHLQIALGQELENVPPFRRYDTGQTAYVEGWGLYSESLGAELGLYRDPHSRFGQLTYEIWRAIRLVVDTGMHWKGWSRDEAIAFFEANAGKASHDIAVEIDRYIVWPGQALAYKIGELKIRELRRRATEALGEAFDIRAFHDLVLGAGALPLSILEAQVEEWIGRKGEGIDERGA
jgi:uncharacterized protein (DUF885 family)